MELLLRPPKPKSAMGRQDASVLRINEVRTFRVLFYWKCRESKQGGCLLLKYILFDMYKLWAGSAWPAVGANSNPSCSLGKTWSRKSWRGESDL